ncbi:Hypothetical protein A7982_02330 [Minicystis rosea]|nr:Hypothetical protein A7982_02330 [Minicystis rosea]
MKKVLVAALLSVSGLGCARVFPYTSMSSHTIQVADKQEADIIWVGDLRDDTMLRCHNAPEGPKCVRVKQ